jgi:peptidoglycan hydrolase CwlO-like protein
MLHYFRAKTILLLLVFILVFGSFGSLVLAQEDCNTVEECQALLEKYEKEIFRYESTIAKTKEEQRTLNNKIYLLRQKINKLQTQIKQSNLIIRDLEFQLEDTQVSIEKTSNQIDNLKTTLANLLKAIHEQDQRTALEVLFSGEDFSDFFENLVFLENLLTKNREVLNDIKALKADLEKQGITLESEKEEWEKMKKMQILQQQESERIRREKEWLLQKTKGEEAEYQKLLEQSRAKANEIRNRIFDLIGVPEIPTFGQALEMAKYVEKMTGVRPAFLLAVLTQESNIGRNVGQCYLKDPNTGSGIVAKTGKVISRVMKPSRDVPHFLTICKETGRNPYNTLVSCPMSFGYGGAMGPAQFIPSTWVMYKDRVRAITGKAADPWNIRDAFLAAGLLLRDAGAARQTYNAEWRAAMVYFSGSTNPKYSFYGNAVMSITRQYEEDIAQLERFAKK